MAGEWKQGAPGGKWRGDAPHGRPGQPDPKWKTDKPTGPPVQAGWWLKAGAAAVGLIGVVVGAVVLIEYLKPPPRPVFVAVGADPAVDAGKLNVPFDLYGWLGGKKLIAAIQELAQAAGDTPYTPKAVTTANNAPLPLPAEDGLAEFVNTRLAGYDPVVLYLGVHTGVGEDGSPHLVGEGGTRVRVGKLLTAIAENWRPRKPDGGVVVLLDPGRRRPDPLTGHLHDPFAAQLKEDKEVAAALNKLPQMVVVCGAGPGDRGWESEELQQTAFARAVLRGLRGEAQASKGQTLRAGELFEFARRTTEEWSASNRPTVQRPFLLPDGQDRADRIRLYVLPDNTPPAADPGSQPLPAELAAKWGKHDELAARTPSPASYAPRAWRRYRELLLRYEQSVRAGESATATALSTEIGVLDKQLEHAPPPTPTAPDRDIPSLALAAAVAGGRLSGKAADADNILRQLGGREGADQLRAMPTDLWPAPPPEVRPAEVHLPVMVRHFYSSVLAPAGKRPPAPPAQWATAVAVRRLAERAAVGLPDNASGPLFPERVWPAVRKTVSDADRLRRDAEDLLFATDPDGYKRSEAALAEAGKRYADAVTAATKLHRAADVRDRALADLPFYSRWAADAGRESSISYLLTAWDRAQQLNDAFADPGPLAGPAKLAAVVTLADELDGLMPKVRDDFAAEDERLKQPEAQADWWKLQHLLATPFVKGRMDRLAASRRTSKGLLDGSASRGRVPAEAGRATVSETATRDTAAAHARFARLALSAAWLGTPNPSLPPATALDADLARLEGNGWQQAATAVGNGLARHFAALSKAVPDDYKSLPALDRADQVHRSAVALEGSDRMEPAAVAGRVRWRELLADHARRAIADHWYDETFDPKQTTHRQYFKDAAELYRTLAKQRMTSTEGPAIPPVQHNDWLDAPLDVFDTLHLAADPAQANGITWTSDRRRPIGFVVTMPNGLPDDVTGTAVVLRKPVDDQLRLLKWPDGVVADRRPVPVGRGQPPQPVTADLVANDTSAGVTEARGMVRAEAYFRGQRPPAAIRVVLNREPSLVLLDPGPTAAEKGARVAVRADRDVPLGSVVILIDYSGSMKNPAGNRKIDAALAALNRVLLALPSGTPLRIRIFADKGSNDGHGSTVVFPQADEPAAVTWGVTGNERLTRLMQTLNGKVPEGFTPLVETIRTAVEKDFTEMPDGPRTLLVLTDGVDEELNDVPPGTPEDQERAVRIASIRRRIQTDLRITLNALFKTGKGKNVSLQVVQFGLSPDDAELSEELFKDREDYEEPSKLWPATTADLDAQLLYAIRPKLKLTGQYGDRLAGGLSTTGLKTTTDTRPGPPFAADGVDLKWSAGFPAGEYKADAVPTQGRTNLQLQARDGDRMILGFAKGDRGILIRRELYADYWPADASADRADGLWRMAVPKAYRDFKTDRFHAHAFLEQVPNHRLRPPREPDATLTQPVPEVVWWQLDRYGPDGKVIPDPLKGAVVARRRYGYKAPAWELTAQWEKEPSGAPRPARITARVPVGSVEPTATYIDDAPVPALDRDTALNGPARTKDGDPLVVRLAVEAAYPDKTLSDGEAAPPAGPGAGWLVVRITHPRGRPVLAVPLANGLRPTFVEHRFYKTKENGKEEYAEYTGLFGPALSADALQNGRLRLRIVPLAPLLGAPQTELVCPTAGSRPDRLRPDDAKAADYPERPQPYIPEKR